MIISIGQWVPQEACRDTHGTQFPTTPPLMISVNFSSKQLAQPDLINQIKSFA